MSSTSVSLGPLQPLATMAVRYTTSLPSGAAAAAAAAAALPPLAAVPLSTRPPAKGPAGSVSVAPAPAVPAELAGVASESEPSSRAPASKPCGASFCRLTRSCCSASSADWTCSGLLLFSAAACLRPLLPAAAASPGSPAPGDLRPPPDCPAPPCCCRGTSTTTVFSFICSPCCRTGLRCRRYQPVHAPARSSCTLTGHLLPAARAPAGGAHGRALGKARAADRLPAPWGAAHPPGALAAPQAAATKAAALQPPAAATHPPPQPPGSPS
jgi:hypothetical protein